MGVGPGLGEEGLGQAARPCGGRCGRSLGAADRLGLQHLSSPLASVAVANKLCQSYQTFNICYAETGLLGAHFVCDRMSIDDMVFFLQGQW